MQYFLTFVCQVYVKSENTHGFYSIVSFSWEDSGRQCSTNTFAGIGFIRKRSRVGRYVCYGF